jgi:hypothetical protein
MPPSSDIDDKLPTIIARGRQLNPLLREIAASLHPDEKLFRHGGGLITVNKGTITHYTAEAMPALLSRWANYIDCDGVGMFPPATAAKSILFSVSDDDGIRPLERIVNVPTLRADGTLLNTPGYDSASKLLYYPTSALVKMEEHPTLENAQRAVTWLMDMLCDFPFDSESSRSNFIGLLLTFVVRPLCGNVPLALLDAPIMGSGKTLLAEITHITATGGKIAGGVQIGDATETRKNLTSQLRESPSIIVIDNADGVIDSPVLAAILTMDTWKDRLLGYSRILTLPVRSVFVATGNNLRIGKDMPRRCYHIRIDANVTQPWRRGETKPFKYRLPDYALENRGMIAAALLTMARAWIEAGRPRGEHPILGSFEAWCEVVGGILQFAGVTGFLGNLDEMRRSTSDEEDSAEVWEAWMAAIYAKFGDEAFTVSQLAEAMWGMYAGELKETLPYSLGDIGGSCDRSWLIRLGKALHDRVGQVFDVGGKLAKLTRSKDLHKKQKSYKLVNMK